MIGLIILVLFLIVVIALVAMFIAMQKENLTQNDEVIREVMKTQNKIMQAYRKRLSEKHLKTIQTFVGSGKGPGTREYFQLPPLVQEVILKLSISQAEAMSQFSKNPLRKGQLWLAKTMTIKMATAGKPKKKKKKK